MSEPDILDGLRAVKENFPGLLDGVVDRATAEIERLRSLVGKADVGQSFTDMMSKVARRSVEPDEPPWDT